MLRFVLKKISVAASLLALLILGTPKSVGAELATRADSRTPSLAKSFSAASVRASPGLNCKLYPPGAPSAGVSLVTDDDGYARFHAAKSAAHDAIQRLVLDCLDASGKSSTYSVDLTSSETFAPNPINLAKSPGTDRPALTGDPLSHAQSQLLAEGYGLRPDPVKNPGGYARWLAAATKPGRLLSTTKTIMPPMNTLPPGKIQKPVEGRRNLLVPQQGGAWYGAVLTGAPDYVFTLATFYVPQAIPGGDNTGNTHIYIWNGLGGNSGEAGLISGRRGHTNDRDGRDLLDLSGILLRRLSVQSEQHQLQPIAADNRKPGLFRSKPRRFDFRRSLVLRRCGKPKHRRRLWMRLHAQPDHRRDRQLRLIPRLAVLVGQGVSLVFDQPQTQAVHDSGQIGRIHHREWNQWGAYRLRRSVWSDRAIRGRANGGMGHQYVWR